MKTPCNNCPFRSDRPFHGLRRDRLEEIVSTLKADGAFHCHKTIDYSDEFEGAITTDSELCVGAAIFLEQTRPGGMLANLSFRLGARCGELTPKELSAAVPVYKSVDELLTIGD